MRVFAAPETDAPADLTGGVRLLAVPLSLIAACLLLPLVALGIFMATESPQSEPPPLSAVAPALVIVSASTLAAATSAAAAWRCWSAADAAGAPSALRWARLVIYLHAAAPLFLIAACAGVATWATWP